MSIFIKVWGNEQIDFNTAVTLTIPHITAILVFLVVSADLASNLTLSTRIPALEVILLSTSLNLE